MTILFKVGHTIPRGSRVDRKGIGIFTTRAGAVAAIEAVQSLPGFRLAPTGFKISEVRLGHGYLPTGYDRTETPGQLFGIDSQLREGGLFSLDAVNRVDIEANDDDFVLIGLFSSEAEAKIAERAVAREIDQIRYRLEINWASVDRVNWSHGFGPE